MKQGGPLKRKTRLRPSGPTKAKKVAKLKKHYASAEYKAARAERMDLAQGRCEARYIFLKEPSGLRLFTILLPGEEMPVRINNPELWYESRCPLKARLQFHEVHYGSKIGLQRAIEGFIVCDTDHQYIEMTRFPHRHRAWA